MTDRVEADTHALDAAAGLIEKIGESLADIAAETTRVMGHMTVACGDDHFGHKFTDGDRGYRKQCDNASDMGKGLAGDFAQQARNIGYDGAAGDLDVTDEISGANVRRAV